MILSESSIRSIIKKSLIQKIIKENEEIDKLSEKLKQNSIKDQNPKEFSQNVIRILDLCKNKINDIMWKNDKIEQQKAFISVLFNPANDTAAEFFKSHAGIEKLKKKFYNSPLEILMQNMMTNKEFLNPLGKVNPVDQKKDTRKPLIDLINNKSKHQEIVNRLIKTVAYRLKKNPVGRYRSEDYTSPEAQKNMNQAWEPDDSTMQTDGQ